MADGKIDVVLEDWAAPRPSTRSTSTKAESVVQRRAARRRRACIGWYIPTYLLQAVPEFATWEGLKARSVFNKNEVPGR